MNQLSFASLDFAAKKKRTKRDVFLTEMAAVVPWGALEALIEPHYPKVGPQGGRRPFPLSTASSLPQSRAPQSSAGSSARRECSVSRIGASRNISLFVT